MASFPACYKIDMITLATALLLVVSSISAFPIDKDCQDKAFEIVKENVKNAITNETRMGASLLRLHFHDCVVNGCDGSVLLDDTPNSKGEKGAIPNRNSIRGFEVIDVIKEALEAEFPGVVSCADILAIAARDAVTILGGPTWVVNLGRRDSLKASLTAANKAIPPPNSSIGDLTTKFQALGLSLRDLVALSGSHTIGLARCTSFRARIYNDSPKLLNKYFAKLKQHDCPRNPGTPKDNNTASLDLKTPNCFDNSYFINLITKSGLLHSDQQLYSGGSDDSMNLVQDYANNMDTFNNDFISAMIKMGNINILTGSKGEIRKNCREINKP